MDGLLPSDVFFILVEFACHGNIRGFNFLAISYLPTDLDDTPARERVLAVSLAYYDRSLHPGGCKCRHRSSTASPG
jgi:hypothetical protein